MKRIPEIDRMLGLAMILVVIGHLRAGNYIPEWYYPKFYGYIYSFHMAVFLFLSAFLIRYSYKGCESWRDYRHYVVKKFKKFFLPFLLIGGIGIIVKVGFSDWSAIQHGIEALLLEPRASYSGFLWYIYLLFIFYCISPLFFYFSPKIQIILMLLSLLGVAYPLPTQILCLDHFSRFLFFYLAGVLAAQYLPQLRQLSEKWALAGAMLFTGWTLYYFLHGNEPYFFLAECLAVIAMIWLVRRIPSGSGVSRILDEVGKNCFIIYLLHMFVIRGAVLLGNRWNWINNIAVLYMMATAAAAIAIPVFLVRAVARQNKHRQTQ